MIYKNYSVFLIFLFAYFVLPGSMFAETFATIQSFNRQDFYFSYNNVQGIIYQVNNQASKELATFIIRKGLAASGKQYISLEAAAWPGYFLRHQSRALKLQKRKDNKFFQESATFVITPGLATGGQGWFSFKLFNHPEFYIRHKESMLLLEADDGSPIFKQDATFRFIQPLWDGKHKTVKTKTPIPATAGTRDESVIIMLVILGITYLGLNLVSRLRQKKAPFAVLTKKAIDSTTDQLLPEPTIELNPEENKKTE